MPKGVLRRVHHSCLPPSIRCLEIPAYCSDATSPRLRSIALNAQLHVALPHRHHDHTVIFPALNVDTYTSDPPWNTTITNLKGWHSRALTNLYPTPLSSRNLATSSSMADPDAFTVAFLRDTDNRNVVVDALGRVLSVSEEDYQGMIKLSQSQSWTIDHGGATCQPHVFVSQKLETGDSTLSLASTI